MNITWLAILLIVALPAPAACDSCETMIKELARLRQAYHTNATGEDAEKKSLTFDGLAAKLDEIIELKKKMGEAGCEVRSKTSKFEAKKYSGTQTTHAKKRRRGKRSRRSRARLSTGGKNGQ
jgi:hypothetical protein